MRRAGTAHRATQAANAAGTRPPEIEAFLLEPNPAVVATLRADGSPHSVATWYDWVDGRILLNMDARAPGSITSGVTRACR